MTKTEITKFLNTHKFKYDLVHPKEKEILRMHLLSCKSAVNTQNFETMIYYKTEFVNIINLVKEREIYINKGLAYFPEEDMMYLILSELHSQLREQLQWNVKLLPNIINQDRIHVFLNSLSIVMPRFTEFQRFDITLDSLEEISNHYPLCMKHIHDVLKSTHHLKHNCRMQYGIFLKNLGLPYDDAMKFFEQEFTQCMSKDWFCRKYSYYFKHYYGKVGGKIDYQPDSCKFLQRITPSFDQHHGCPFKHWDKNILVEKFYNDGLCSKNIRDIEDLISGENYQQACTEYYCATRKVYRDTIIESPNQYCAESLTLELGLDNILESLCDTV